MDSQLFSQIAENSTTFTCEDIPSFEEAFDISSLREFYQKQNYHQKTPIRAQFFSLNFSSEKNLMMSSSPSGSPNEEWNPLKLSQNTSSSSLDSPVSTTLCSNQENTENTSESFPSSPLCLPSNCFEYFAAEPLDSKPIMKKPFKIIRMTEKVETEQNYEDKVSTYSSLSPQDDYEILGFEKLIKAKKIFKIQKDLKPKVSSKTAKKKAALKNKNKDKYQELSKFSNHLFNFVVVMQQQGTLGQ